MQQARAYRNGRSTQVEACEMALEPFNQTPVGTTDVGCQQRLGCPAPSFLWHFPRSAFGNEAIRRELASRLLEALRDECSRCAPSRSWSIAPRARMRGCVSNGIRDRKSVV